MPRYISCLAPIFLFLNLFLLIHTLEVPLALDHHKHFHDTVRVLTPIPRAIYRVVKDSDSPFWILRFDVKSENFETPMLILPYTPRTWISSKDNEKLNLKELTCTSKVGCERQDSSTVQYANYLNYTMAGTAATIRPAPKSLTSSFGFLYTRHYRKDELDRTRVDFKKPPLTVSGGLGLGLNLNESSEDYLQSFGGLDNYVASLYLSQIDFDVSSELIIGDYNPAYIEPNEPPITLNVSNGTSWSLKIHTVKDEDRNVYVDEDVEGIFDPNLQFIGVPDAYYNHFIDYLSINWDLDCKFNANWSYPTCTCLEDTFFPNITFKVGSVKWNLTEDLYVERLDDSKCRLLFGPNSNISAIDPYKKYWIFGTPVMSYYYTQFDFNDVTKPQIVLHKARTFTKNARWYLIISLCTLLVLGGGVFAFYLMLKKSKDEMVEETETNPLMESQDNESGVAGAKEEDKNKKEDKDSEDNEKKVKEEVKVNKVEASPIVIQEEEKEDHKEGPVRVQKQKENDGYEVL